MSLFEKTYKISGWKSNYRMTSSEIYTRVLNDSKSDYNWFASASELVRICKMPDFPTQYAQKIENLILNCFANIEQNGGEYFNDENAVNFCYNSLKDIEVKRRFIEAMIQHVIWYNPLGLPRIPIHLGKDYEHFCQKWKSLKIKEFNYRKAINIGALRTEFYLEFEKIVSEAEGNHTFQDDVVAEEKAFNQYDLRLFQ